VACEKIPLMEISREQLQRFIELYRTNFGIELQAAEAEIKATSLLRFLALTIAPLDFSEIDGTVETSTEQIV
jgi:hypothetical protein